MGWTSPEARDMFLWFVRYEAESRSRDRQNVSTALQVVPASQEALDALRALSAADAECALRTHPGYLGERKIESVRTMLDLFHCALADLAAAIMEFPESGEPNDRSLRENLERQVSIRVNKELFAALGAAKTLVDYSRRIKDIVDAKAFDTKLRETFNPGEHALIVQLRDSVHHAVHSRANWQKRWAAGMQTTHFVIEREELLAEGNLNRAARKHLDHLGTTCDVTEVLYAYAERVNTFYSWLLPEVGSHLPLEISDYRACRKAVKRHHEKLSYKFMIGLWTQAGADPYDHLPKHLTSEQIEEVAAFPQRSSQQVDYVIACMDKEGICDDDLRAIVYKFFGVSAPEKEIEAENNAARFRT